MRSASHFQTVATPLSRRYALALAALTALFALRVAGQAIQWWAPQTLLPAFEDFQGSSLPYSVLLSTQIVLLIVMAHATLRVSQCRSRMGGRTLRALTWFGIVYLAVSFARVAVGLAIPGAASWFTAWIPAFFHLVLASFVLTLALSRRA